MGSKVVYDSDTGSGKEATHTHTHTHTATCGLYWEAQLYRNISNRVTGLIGGIAPHASSGPLPSVPGIPTDREAGHTLLWWNVPGSPTGQKHLQQTDWWNAGGAVHTPTPSTHVAHIQCTYSVLYTYMYMYMYGYLNNHVHSVPQSRKKRAEEELHAIKQTEIHNNLNGLEKIFGEHVHVP